MSSFARRLSSTTIDSLKNRSKGGLLYAVGGNSDGQRGAHLALSPAPAHARKQARSVRQGFSTWHFVRSFGLFSARRGGNFPLLRPEISTLRGLKSVKSLEGSTE